jgi:hypothetical protein
MTIFQKFQLEDVNEMGCKFFQLPKEAKHRYRFHRDAIFGWIASEQESCVFIKSLVMQASQCSLCYKL